MTPKQILPNLNLEKKKLELKENEGVADSHH
jgi:hypothetical protein